MLADQRHSLARALHTRHAIDHDEPILALDHRELADVVAAHLVEPVDDLEQTRPS